MNYENLSTFGKSKVDEHTALAVEQSKLKCPEPWDTETARQWVMADVVYCTVDEIRIADTIYSADGGRCGTASGSFWVWD